MAFLDESGVERLWIHILAKFNGLFRKEDTATEVTEEESNPVSGAAVYNYIAENFVISNTEPTSPTKGMFWFKP